MKLGIRAMGLSVGVVVGLAVLLSTLYSLWVGAGQTIGYVAYVVPGFSRSYPGAIVGLVGGFCWGFIAGTLFAGLYNVFHGGVHKSEPRP